LGHDDPEDDLPPSLAETAELLFSRASLWRKRGNLEGAVALIRRCLELDGGSIDAKRAFLSEALGWACENPVRAHEQHFRSEQVEALRHAIQSLEPLEQTLSQIQSDQTSLEISSNVATALWLLGEKKRAFSIAAISLARHPTAEGLLRIRLKQLETDDDIQQIRKSMEPYLAELSPTILTHLIELAANSGDVTWYDVLIKRAEVTETEKEHLLDLSLLRFQARWIGGERDGALSDLQAYLEINPSHFLARVMLTQFLAQQKNVAGAVTHAEIALKSLGENSSLTEIMQLAGTLFRLEQFESAVPLYERLVSTPGKDRLTRDLLICLIETERRQQAQSVLDRMPIEVRRSSAIRRIECHFAQRTGNWSRVKELLRDDINNDLVRADLAVAYACALYKLDELDSLRDFLRRDPKFKNASPKEEFEFAKYQTGFGYHQEAIRRLFQLFLENPNNSEIAGYYLSQLILSPPLPGLEEPPVASAGTAVRLQGGGDAWWVAIGDAGVREGAWPELVAADSTISKQLEGVPIGKKVVVSRGAIKLDAEVVELKSIFAFAADKANELIAAAVSPAGPLYSFPVFNEGEPNVEVLLGIAAERRKYVQQAIGVYRERRLPLCLLARLLGTDVASLLLDWPGDETLFVGIGTHEERELSIKLAASGDRRFVIDLVTVVELTRRGAFKAAVKILGRPLIPQSSRDELVGAIQMLDRQNPASVMSEVGGRLSITEVPVEYYSNRSALLRAILENIDHECEVCPVLGPQEASDDLRKTVQLLDGSTGDVLFLCAEKNAVLVSEDGGLRQLAYSAGITSGTGIQPILMVAAAKGAISKEAYAKIVAAKIIEKHDFVSVRIEDMELLASLTPNIVSKEMRAILESFRRPTIDINSTAMVAVDFLRRIILRCPLKVAAEYSRIVRDVLLEGRPAIKNAVLELISKVLQQRFGRNGRKLGFRERSLFDGLLDRRLASSARRGKRN